ncbi:MAG: AmmeMemoRadiSam system protein B [Planctomycetota bacterium]
MTRPRFRPLSVIAREVNGRRVLCLKDAEGISDRMAMLPPAIVPFFFDVFDGNHTLEEIREEYHRRSGGDRIPEGDLEELVAHLDAALLLDSPRFREHFAALVEEWRRLETRPASHAGGGYPAEPADLTSFLDGLYDGIELAESPASLAAVAVPHLDLHHGGRTAAAALAGIDASFDGDTIVILGVGHQSLAQPYALTPKPFETPLGTVEVNDELFHAVVAKAGSWLLDDEYAHRGEHSVEFATVLLKHALPDREFRILPVLCGSFHHLLETGEPPRTDPRIGAFLESVAEEAENALVLASVDLAHMGPYYGDEERLTPEQLTDIETADRAALDRLIARDGAGFFAGFGEDHDARRVCGMSALYSLVELLPEGPAGTLTGYEQTVFPEEGNTVTICGLTWEK